MTLHTFVQPGEDKQTSKKKKKYNNECLQKKKKKKTVVPNKGEITSIFADIYGLHCSQQKRHNRLLPASATHSTPSRDTVRPSG
jgi:hypothetical protein